MNNGKNRRYSLARVVVGRNRKTRLWHKVLVNVLHMCDAPVERQSRRQVTPALGPANRGALYYRDINVKTFLKVLKPIILF